MALINCRGCKTRVSDKAKQCPKCGAPIGRVDDDGLVRATAAQKRVQQRQLQIHSMLAMTVFGIGAFIVLFVGGKGTLGSVGITLTTVGFIAYVVTRIRLALGKRA